MQGHVRLGGAVDPVAIHGGVQFSDTVFAQGSVSLGSDSSKKTTMQGTVQGMNPVRFTGGTLDTTTLAVEDPTADNHIIFPDESGAVLTTSSSAAFGELVLHGELSLQGGVALGDEAADVLDVIGSVAGSSPLHFEGPNADSNDMTLHVAEPTSSRTLSIPDESGHILVSASSGSSLTAVGALSVGALVHGFSSIHVASAAAASASTTNGATIYGNAQIGDDADDSTGIAGVLVNENAMLFEGGQVDGLQLQLRVPSPTTNNVIAMPDASGTSVLQSTDRFLSIDTAGDLLFEQAQITEVGQVQAGSLGYGFGAIEVEALRTDAVSALSNAATFGDGVAFGLKRAAVESVQGVRLELSGQDGHGSGQSTGGDISVQPGLADGGLDGNVRLSSTMVVSREQITLAAHVVAPVQVDAGGARIESNRVVQSRSVVVSQSAIDVHSAVTAAVASSDSDNILVGGDASFVMGRPSSTSLSPDGASLRVTGQMSYSGGGDLTLHPGQQGAGAAPTAGALVVRASTPSGAGDIARVLTDGMVLSQPFVTTGIDAHTAAVRTSGSLQPGTVVVAGSTSAVKMFLTTSVTSPVLIHTSNVVTLGGDSSFSLARPVQAGTVPGQLFQITGQDGSVAAGGDVVLRPGQGGTVRLAMVANGIGINAGGVDVALPLSTLDLHADNFPIAASTGVASDALVVASSVVCATLTATSVDGTWPSVTSPRLYGIAHTVNVGSDTAFRIQRTTATGSGGATLTMSGQPGHSGGDGGDVVLVAGAGNSNAGGSTQMGVIAVQTNTVSVGAITNSNNIQIRDAQSMRTDAAHGVIGQAVQVSVSATVNTAIGASLQTPAMVSTSDRTNIGDDDPFSVSRPLHGSGAGRALKVQGQSGTSGATGGTFSVRPGHVAQSKVFYLVQPAAAGLAVDATIGEATSYCRSTYDDIAAITTDAENILAAKACLLDTGAPMHRCMFGGSNGDAATNPTRAWAWSDASAYSYANWQGDEGGVASNSGRTAYIGFGSSGVPHQWQDWASFSHVGQFWGFLCQARLHEGSTVLQSGASTAAITVAENDLVIGQPLSITGSTVSTSGAGAFGSFGAGDAALSGAVDLGQANELVYVDATVVPASDGSDLLRFDGVGQGTLTFQLPPSGVTGNRLVEFPNESGQVLTTGDFASVETLNANGGLFEMGNVATHFIEFNGHVSPVTSTGSPGPLLFDHDSDGFGLQWGFPAAANLDHSITFPDGSSCTTAAGVHAALSTQVVCEAAGHTWQAGTVLTDSSLVTTMLTQLGTLTDLDVATGTLLSGALMAGSSASGTTESTTVVGTATMHHDATLSSAGRTAAFTVGKKPAVGATGGLTLKGPNSLEEGVFNGGDVYLIGGQGGSVHTDDAHGGRVTIDGGGYVGSTAALQNQAYQLPNSIGGLAASCADVPYEYRSICAELGGPSGTYTGNKVVYGGVYIGSDSGKVRIGKSQSQCGDSQTCESTMRGDTTFTGDLTVQKLSATVDAANVLLLGDDDEFILCATCKSPASALRQKGASFVLQGQAGEGGVGAGGNVVVRPGQRGSGGASDGNLVIRSAEVVSGALLLVVSFCSHCSFRKWFH